MNKINIVFMPISIYCGMAGSQRLNNYLSKFEERNVKYKSLVLSSQSIDRIGDFEKLIQYKGFISRIFAQIKAIVSLLYFKLSDYKNILYFYGYPDVTNIHLILFAKLFGYKIIFDIVEDNRVITNPKSRLSSFKINTSLFLIRKIKHFSNGVVVISSHLKKMMETYTVSKIPILYIPISINKIEFISCGVKEFKVNNLVIFYGGSFGEKDGLPILLQAFDEICFKYDCTLVITGIGSVRDMIAFNKLLNKMKHKNKVSYLGYLSRNEYLKNLLTADIHCMNRTNSEFANAGFPFKLGEMLASGSPVICTKVGDVPDYLTHKKNAYIIDPDDKIKLKKALEYLINNPHERRRIGENGRKLSFELFDGNHQAEKLIHFCNLL